MSSLSDDCSKLQERRRQDEDGTIGKKLIKGCCVSA